MKLKNLFSSFLISTLLLFHIPAASGNTIIPTSVLQMSVPNGTNMKIYVPDPNDSGNPMGKVGVWVKTRDDKISWKYFEPAADGVIFLNLDPQDWILSFTYPGDDASNRPFFNVASDSSRSISVPGITPDPSGFFILPFWRGAPAGASSTNYLNLDASPLMVLRNCTVTPDSPCVEKIVGIGKSGKRTEAVLTGKTADGNFEGPNSIFPKSTLEEYRLPGFTFEEPSSDLFLANIYYFGLGNNPCQIVKTYCTANSEFVQVTMSPGGLSRSGPAQTTLLTMPHRSSNLICGEQFAPEPCYRSLNFDNDMTFEITIRMPATFEPAYLNARTDQVSFKTVQKDVTISGNSFNIYTLDFHVKKFPVVLWTHLSPTFDGIDYADTEGDNPLINVFSTRSSVGTELGKCNGIPQLQVITDGTNASVPKWDPINQSVNVAIQGSHFNADASLRQGFFEATISKELGKCLWGINVDQSTKAQISLTYSDTLGGASTETIAVTFDGNNLKVRDSNFHYSNPTVKVRLFNQEVLPKITSITCLKGKLKKQIKAINPKCPLGYKKA